MSDQAGSSWLVLDFEAVTLIDVTAGRTLGRLLEHVAGAHARLSLARTRRAVFNQMREAAEVELVIDVVGPGRVAVLVTVCVPAGAVTVWLFPFTVAAALETARFACLAAVDAALLADLIHSR